MTTLGQRLRAIPSWQITLGLALLALGFLVSAQLASEGPRVRYTSQERTPLVETALELQAQQEELKARILEIRADIQEAERQSEGSAALVAEINDDLEVARIGAGLIPLVGTGVVLQLEDAIPAGQPGSADGDQVVTARDVRILVEELWLAGAEAISVNNERITTPTAIIDIGPSVLVNAAYLAPPYQVAAIGPPDLYDRLVSAVGFVEFISARSQGAGIRVSVYVPDEVSVPAYAGFVNLRFARIVSASPSPPPAPPSAGDGG
jgi:uncharacterized protein YlxW (UPF0749 family)